MLFDIDRKPTFPERLELTGIVFHFSGQSFDNNDTALTEAYFQRKRGNYARIVKRRSTTTGQMRYGVYIARKV